MIFLPFLSRPSLVSRVQKMDYEASGVRSDARWKGIETVKTLPCPSLLFTLTWPLKRETKFFTIASPRPRPSF